MYTLNNTDQGISLFLFQLSLQSLFQVAIQTISISPNIASERGRFFGDFPGEALLLGYQSPVQGPQSWTHRTASEAHLYHPGIDHQLTRADFDQP